MPQGKTRYIRSRVKEELDGQHFSLYEAGEIIQQENVNYKEERDVLQEDRWELNDGSMIAWKSLTHETQPRQYLLAHRYGRR